MDKDSLLAALYDAVHPTGENGHGKTTALGLRAFLSTLIDELVSRTTGAGGTGTGTGTGSPAVLASPHLLTYRLTVTDAGELGTVPANDLPLQDPLDVLTSPNGLTYRLTVADVGTLRTLPRSGLADPDAAAFAAAAGLANAGHEEAVNQLVRALKISNVWPKLRALYPMVGGTARAHALNLKDPRDDDAAFRLTFPHGATHSALGAGWDGATQYADTHLVPGANGGLPLNSCHLAYYTTTDASTAVQVEMGASGERTFDLEVYYHANRQAYFNACSASLGGSVRNSLGFTLGNREIANELTIYRDGRLLSRTMQASPNTSYSSSTMLLGARQDGYFSQRACGLASIGEGLTADEAAAYSAAVRTFQQALGRDVALDDDARLFLEAAGLTDPGQVAAVAELVRSLKASGVWPLLRAVYPMVGGTEQTHCLNLRDPRDADTAFRLTFYSNPVHSARGVEWRAGAGTYADTHLVPAEHLDPADNHLAYYAGTDSSAGVQIEIGCSGNASLSMLVRYAVVGNAMYVEDCSSTQYSAPLAHGLGLALLSRTSLADIGLYRDGQRLALHGFTNGNIDHPTAPLWLGGRQDGQFSLKTCGFASIGRGLTPDQAQDYSAAVRAFQQALGRDVTVRPELLLA